MKRLLITAVLGLLASGCVSFEFPNLISDAVKAGKEVIGPGQKTEPNSKRPAEARGIVFSNTVIGEASAAPQALEGQCLQELEAQAKEKLGTNHIVYKVVAREVVRKGERLVATCSLEIV